MVKIGKHRAGRQSEGTDRTMRMLFPLNRIMVDAVKLGFIGSKTEAAQSD
jgi:hypothetical protein